eukprot:c37281_g1_i1 orf=67-285(+)
MNMTGVKLASIQIKMTLQDPSSTTTLLKEIQQVAMPVRQLFAQVTKFTLSGEYLLCLYAAYYCDMLDHQSDM